MTTPQRSLELADKLKHRDIAIINNVFGNRLRDITEEVETVLRRYAEITQYYPVCRENEAAIMTSLAYFIASSSNPEDPRLEVAYAIARLLKFDWPSAIQNSLDPLTTEPPDA